MIGKIDIPICLLGIDCAFVTRIADIARIVARKIDDMVIEEMDKS
jgi:hypothetical protein